MWNTLKERGGYILKMGLIREFSYPDIFQRRVINYNSFLTFFLLGFAFTECTFLMNYYLPYQPVLKIIALIIITGIFLGNLLGNLLFAHISRFRPIFIASEILFIISSIVYLLRNIISGGEEPFLTIMHVSPLFIPLLLLLLPFFAGVKMNYLLKVSCGNFIDDKKGTISLFILAITGFAAGIAVFAFVHLYPSITPFFVVLPLTAVPLLFIIKLPYSPTPLYARDSGEREASPVHSDKNKRDYLYFSFLNVTSILIYLVLGHHTIVQTYSNTIYVSTFFMFTSSLFIVIAIIAARTVRSAFWFIYTEMLFPIFFLLFLVLLMFFGNRLPFYVGTICFMLPALAFGFSIYHTLEYILSTYDHNKRYNIITISIFMLPIPILFAISFIQFTYLWYFILLYIISFINIILPGIHLFQRQIQAYKKIAYFVLSLIFIPAIILMHLFFSIPLNSDLYINNTRGFTEISNINYNADFIKQKADLYLYDKKIFSASDSIIRNMKRSLIPAYLFHHNVSGTILFLDGYQKFFNNEVIGEFERSICIDYLPERIVDYERRPFTGSQRYIPEKTELLIYLLKEKRFGTIVDIPNLYDQSSNPFRFSKEYGRIIKKNLIAGGIYTLIIDTANCSEAFLYQASIMFRRTFQNVVGFIFANYLVILGSDSRNSLEISNVNLEAIQSLFEEKHELNCLFYSRSHFLSHLLFIDSNHLIENLRPIEVHPYYSLRSLTSTTSLKSLIEKSELNHTTFLQLVNRESDPGLLRRLESDVIRNSTILTHLKITENAEMRNEYERETENLFKLKRYAEYNRELRNYLTPILSFKEVHYHHTALQLEKEKKWDEAKRLYQAILTLNSNNFEAYYRLGILNITLQNLEESFQYLQQAMRLSRDEPRVLYQMGVLFFSSGKPTEALTYLKRALTVGENSASLHLYLGLCYEELNRLHEAKKHYQKALLLDPNDNRIVTSVERIETKIEEERRRWMGPEMLNQNDDEKGEKIPLPIINSARKKRLTDEEAEKLENSEEEHY